MTSSVVPALVAAPAMPLAVAVARSSARIRAPSDLRGRGAAQALEIHAFEFADGAHGFQLMPGRYALLSLRDALIDGVHVSPHLEYLDPEQSAETLERCAARLEHAGWSRASSDSPARACAIVGSTGEAVAGAWRTERWAAQLRLRRVHQVSSPIGRLFKLTQDAHLVTLSIALSSART